MQNTVTGTVEERKGESEVVRTQWAGSHNSWSTITEKGEACKTGISSCDDTTAWEGEHWRETSVKKKIKMSLSSRLSSESYTEPPDRQSLT